MRISVDTGRLQAVGSAIGHLAGDLGEALGPLTNLGVDTGHDRATQSLAHLGEGFANELSRDLVALEQLQDALGAAARDYGDTEKAVRGVRSSRSRFR